jgi:transcriptional regulator with XRE-family HTH domain
MALRRELDERQRWFRAAGKGNVERRVWLREVRKALGIPVAEVAGALKKHRSAVAKIEQREEEKTISILALEQAAEALGCELVYSIVPRKGTLVELAEVRGWKKRLGKGSERERGRTGLEPTGRTETEQEAKRRATEKIREEEELLAWSTLEIVEGKLRNRQGPPPSPDEFLMRVRARTLSKLEELRKQREGLPVETEEARLAKVEERHRQSTAEWMERQRQRRL